MPKLDWLGECLFLSFADTDSCDPQDRSRMWAILEGIDRLKTLDPLWRVMDDSKSHECIRGCTIAAGSTYFHWTLWAWTRPDELIFCASCMAMVLYFKGVQHLPHYRYTHWDYETQRPVRINSPRRKRRGIRSE